MELQYGNWHVVRELGSGAFGTVYEIEQADDLGFATRSALKVIRIPQYENQIDELRSQGEPDEAVAEYFREMAAGVLGEVRVMYQLKGHSNIVSYEDHQARLCEDGIGWELLIRMELLTPLNKYIKEHEITRKTVIKLGIDICSALERCQSLNMIHRDIKPSNILVSENGDFKLSDFGIARRVAEDATISVLSQKGTSTYMAPEVCMGRPYGFGVDIYSLGIIMYQLLNHYRMPFLPVYPERIHHGDNSRALVRRMKGAPLPCPDQASGQLAAIVLKACSYDPANRYSSPRQMREDLETLLSTKAYWEQTVGTDAEILTIPGSDRSNGSPSTSGASAGVKDGTQKLNSGDSVLDAEQKERAFSDSLLPEDATMNLTGNEDYTMVLNGHSAKRTPVDGAEEKKTSTQPKMEGTSPKKTDAAQDSREKPEPQKAKKSNPRSSARGRQVGKILLAALVDILFSGLFFWGAVIPQMLICVVLCTISGYLLGTMRKERFHLLQWKLLACLAVSLCAAILSVLMGVWAFMAAVVFVEGIFSTLAGFWVSKTD